MALIDRAFIVAACAALALLAAPAQARYPDKSVRIVVPFDSRASVEPSGGEEITERAATMPPAPGWFST